MATHVWPGSQVSSHGRPGDKAIWLVASLMAGLKIRLFQVFGDSCVAGLYYGDFRLVASLMAGLKIRLFQVFGHLCVAGLKAW